MISSLVNYTREKEERWKHIFFFSLIFIFEPEVCEVPSLMDDALALTYEASFDAMMLDVQAIASLKTTDFTVDHNSKEASSPLNDQSSRGPMRWWKAMEEALAISSLSLLHSGDNSY